MHARSLKCVYCLRKVADSYVRCVECDSVNLCVTCFSTGAEGGVHKKCHRYSIEAINYSKIIGLFESDDPWNFDEELKLTEAVETYGYGNWSEVALQVCGRTAVECRQHYERFYVNGSLGSEAVLPNALHVGCTVDHTQPNDSEPQHDRWLDHRNDVCGRLGYMPYRDEFEYEYCNDAEGIISRVPFGSTDQLEFELQLALVAIYNQHLAKRQLCHTIARAHGLLTSLSHQAALTPKQRRSQHLPLARKPNVNKPQVACGHGTNRLIPCNLRSNSRCTIGSRLNPVKLNRNDDIIMPLDACSSVACAASSLESSSVKLANDPGNRTSLCTAFGPPCSVTRHWHCLGNEANGVRHIMRNRTTSIHLDGTESNVLYSSCTRCTDRCAVAVAASQSASDSGICSGDSCAQSTASNGSTTGDPGMCIRLAKTPVPCPVRTRRPRSNSDSMCMTTALGQTPDLMVKLTRLHQPDQVSRTPVIPTETSDPPNENNETPQSHGIQPADEQPVIKRRRGRPPRIRRCIPPRSENSLLFRRTNGEAVVANQIPVYPEWMNPFLRYLTRDEAHKLNGNLQRESELRAECELLTKYHRQGIRYMRDIPSLPIIGLPQTNNIIENATRPRKPRVKKFIKIRPRNRAARGGQLRIRQRRLVSRKLTKPLAFVRQSSGIRKRGRPKIPRGRGSKALRAHR